jgi:hypothetical protein
MFGIVVSAGSGIDGNRVPSFRLNAATARSNAAATGMIPYRWV